MNLKFEEIEHKLRESSKSQRISKPHGESELLCDNVFSPKIAAQLLNSTDSFDPNLIEVKQVQQDESLYQKSVTHSRSSLGELSHPPCPEVYEKLIQDLEGDVRKHIRVQQ